MRHPRDYRCFVCGESPDLLSAIGIKKMVDTGQLAPLDPVYVTDGGTFYAKDIADFRVPKWLTDVETDRLLNPADYADLGISDEELLANMTPGDLENMPPGVWSDTAAVA